MEHFELVEKLRQKANVSYEEAKNALEKNEWDLLDALVFLENQGRMNKEPTDSFTTKKEPQPKREEELDLRGTFTRFFSYVAELINKANKIQMDVTKSGKTKVSIPLTVLLLLLLFVFWWVVPILVIGLFFGFRYSFRGHQGTHAVNKAMDKAAQTAENIKTGINKDEHRNSEE